MSQVSATPVPDTEPGARPSFKAGPGIQSGGSAATGRGNIIVRVALFILVAIWTIPVIGLLVSSFRDPIAVRTNGWWTVFANPTDFTQWTLDNYAQVLSGGMGNAFINSLMV